MHSSIRRGRRLRRRIAAALSLVLLLQLISSVFVPGANRAADAAPTAKYITFLYSDFNQAASRLQFNGSSSVTDTGALRLTPATADTFGSVFNKERVWLNAGADSPGFSTYFSFKLTEPGNRPDFAAGADGLVFTLQTLSNNAGAIGSGIGYQGISPSIGVEFDTYNNGTENNDPNANHIAVDFNGSVKHNSGSNPAAQVVNGIDFKSGNRVYVWIDYVKQSQTLNVYLSASSTRPGSPTLTQSGINLESLLQSDYVYAGFTAATGSAWENHDVQDWYFTNRFDPIDANCGCYKEAPSRVTAKTTLVDETAEEPVYQTELALSNLANEPGAGIDLNLSDVKNAIFLDPDNDMEPYPNQDQEENLPVVKTDADGKATYFFKFADPDGDLPSFRATTEFGAYQDVQITTRPEVATGAVTPQYSSTAGSEQQAAAAQVNLTKTGGETVSSWGVQYRLKTDDDSAPWLPSSGNSVLTAPGLYNVQLSPLKEDTYYEARAYATNANGTVYGEPVQFAVQMPMQPGDVQYSRVGPSMVYRDDADSIRLVGTNLNMLLKKLPLTDLSMTISGNGQTYDIPRSSLLLSGTTDLSIKLPVQENGDKLALGTYDLSIHHGFFGDKSFEQAFTITDDAKYRAINYDSVVVENKAIHPDPQQVDKITLRGPFVENASEPGVYRLRDTDAIVTLNDNLLFKGTSLTVDTSNPARDIITGNGRLYVNGRNTIPFVSTYTIYEGSFEFSPENFAFSLPGLSAFDYTGMKLPVRALSFTFIEGGIRISGDADVAIGVGSATIKGSADVDALEFKQNRFDLAAKFAIGADFKTGPLEAGEVRVGVDTRIPSYSGGASAQLRKANIGFDIDLTIKDTKLDAISFAVNKDLKIGSTGAQLTKIGGGVSNMTSLSQAPLTFSVLGGMSDYITPKLDNKHMLNGNDLRIDLSANYFDMSGKLAIYTINVADLDLFVVFNPTGYKGYDRAGFDLHAGVNLLDVLVGNVVAKYFQGSSFGGYADARIQIPGSVPLVGGQRLSSARVDVTDSRMKAGLSVIGIGFTVKYAFSSRDFDWDVDLSSTVKKVATAIVDTGKKIFHAVSSWFWLEAPTDPADPSAPEEEYAITGEKVFDASNVRASLLGSLVPGEISTVVTETNPTVAKDGARFRHTFGADASYKALIAIAGQPSELQLVKPGGASYELRTEAVGLQPANVVYDAASDATVIEADLTKGDWTLLADRSLTVLVHKELFRNGSASLAEIAAKLGAAELQPYVPLDFAKRGTYLIEIVGGQSDTVLVQPDGRPYAIDGNDSNEAWNSSWNAADGKLYLLAEVPEAGQWYAIAAPEAKANLYQLKSGLSMADAMAWINGSEFEAAADFTGMKGKQVMLEIDGANAATQLYRPDGTVYPFEFDSTAGDWNATFDDKHGVINALVDVDRDGLWIVKSSGFTDVFGLTLSEKATMGEISAAGVKYTYSMQMDKKGKFLFDIAGGDADTEIYDVRGNKVAIVSDENDPNRNAILDEAEHSLKAVVDVAMPGIVRIKTVGRASIQQYELTPVPTVAALSATAQTQRNTYEVSWQVDNAKPDTKVTLILASRAGEAAGQVLAEDLPASGIRTVTLPEGDLPGDYYLALKADSESFGPIYKVLDDPLVYQAEKMLTAPTAVTAAAIGNGELALSVTDSKFDEATSYRVLLTDDQGNVDSNGTAFEYDVDPAKGAAQSLVVTGLAPGKTYGLSVMKVYAEYATDTVSGEETVAKLYVSEPTSPVSIELPVPHPAKLDVTLNTNGLRTVDHSYQPYYVTDADLEGLSDEQKQALMQTLTVTASDHVTVQVTADQSATLKLLLNGEPVAAEADHADTFDLGTLSERDYTIDVEAVNAAGDKSAYSRRLIVDHTAPYLYLKSPVNGELVDGNRARLEGVSETGVDLTVNGVQVPVDAMGHFVYYAPIPEGGTLDLDLVATDEVGNVTEHRLEVLKGGGDATGEQNADLAAFGTDEGVLVTALEPAATDYQTSIDERTKTIRVWAVPVDPAATVTIGGQAADERFSALVPVTNGAVIEATVTASDSSVKTYRLHLGTESDLAALSALELSAAKADQTPAEEAPLLSPAFNSTKSSYETNVANDVASVNVKPTEAANGSLIRVNGAIVASGQSSAAIPLAVGDNTVTIEVLSPNAAKAGTPDWTKANAYTVRIARQMSGDSTLKQLELGGIALAPAAFDPETADYSARVGADTTSVSLTFAANDPSATVSVDGTAQGAAGTTALNLEEGSNRFVLTVSAQDGSSRTYALTIFKDKPIDPALTLSELSVKELDLAQDFSPWKRNYDAKTSTLRGGLVVVAQPTVDGTIVKVNGVPVNDEGEAVASLNVGDNSLLVQLESADHTATNTYSIGVTRSFVSSNPNSDTFSVGVNDGENDKIATAKTQKENGLDVMRVTFDADELNKVLDSEHAPILTINAGGTYDKVVSQLNAKLVKKMQEKEAVLHVVAGNSTYTLPASALNIGQIESGFGSDTPLEDVQVLLAVNQLDADKRQAIETKAASTGADLVGAPVEFNVVYSYGGKTIVSDRFAQYVERAVALPDGVDAKQMTTGVRVQDDGSLYHVPTFVREEGGKSYAVMYSYTNSTYAVILNHKTFKDIQGKWSQTAIEDLASRLIVNGTADGLFQPNRNVTRAEFASMAVRALGLAPIAGSTGGYSDVKANDWYAPYVAAAKSYGLINGYSDGTFGPARTITRAEAVAILSKAWTLAGQQAASAEQANAAIDGVADQADIPAWAKGAFAQALHAGLLSGYEDGSVKPLRQLTREETAAMLRNLLIQSKLIQP